MEERRIMGGWAEDHACWYQGSASQVEWMLEISTPEQLQEGSYYLPGTLDMYLLKLKIRYFDKVP